MLTYTDIQKHLNMIEYVVEKNIMPPVFIDTNYRHFTNVTTLNIEEKNKILTWIKDGANYNDKMNVPYGFSDRDKKPLYDFKKKLEIGTKLGNTNKDLFITKVTTLPIKDTVVVTNYKYIIKNKFLHHTEILDLSLNTRKKTSISETYEDKNLVVNINRYLFGWFPGSDIGVFPEGTGIKIYGDKQFLILSHYVPTLQRFEEKSYVLFQTKKKNEEIREIFEFSLWGTSKFLSRNRNKPFLNANEVKTYLFTDTIQYDMSAFTMYFHAHHYCQNMIAYAVTPENDTIPLLKIDKWNFEKQIAYRMDYYLKIPKNSIVYCSALFDNTENNLDNPIIPTKDVYASFDAEDEMFEFFIMHLKYQEGDEKNKIIYNAIEY
ncbi:MAG: hypothetical protein IPP53_17380 [Bacteroidetes bacterium]|nr:hypothetical protein [Bacteroidota bacterium]